jgi:superfamily I DNA/RNA helicase
VIKPENWRPADGLTLEPNALSAATERTSNLALTAGPGAGKTEMLAQRADFILRTGNCKFPKRILAISFKVDASRNLKERVRRRCGQYLSSRFDSHTFHAFAKRIIDRFRPVLTGIDALNPDYLIGDQRVTRKQITFDDLVPFAIDILKKSKIARNAIRQTYSDVFLDEFQDCTDKQYELIRLAFMNTGIRLTAVGDTKQRIMGWAGALEGIFLTFAEDFDAKGLNLYRNFRSQPLLIRMQNEIIKVMDASAAAKDGDIKGEGGQIDIFAFQDSASEASYLVDQIEHWIGVEEIPHSEIAILLSKQADLYAELLMRELEARRIPFRNEQNLQDLSTEPAARLIIDFLSVLYGQREPDAYVRLMDLLVDSGFDEDDQSLLRTDWQKYFQERRAEIGVSKDRANGIEIVWGEVRQFLNKVGRDRIASLSSDYEQGTRLNDVVKDTKTRISEILVKEPDLVKGLQIFSDDRAVRIMTIHKSKGLEFDSVVLLGVEKETFWSDLDAERCAFFVGISRAKRRLVLTRAEERATPSSSPRRWDVQRLAHEEFMGYAATFTDEVLIEIEA